MMTVAMNELTLDSFKDLNEMFSNHPDFIPRVRDEYKDDCIDAAWAIKDILNENNILAEIMTLKNGNAFLDGGIKVFNNTYTHHSVVLLGEVLIDVLHTDKILSTRKYLKTLMKNNPKLRIEHALSTYWYNSDGFTCKLDIQELLKYK